ncbi:hypothetical protein [Actinomadura sp. KC216]|uniref:hypothetical protein n=1 Tax=Actinomadura sp. KC216 TaxID=2530370 RepID=UPI001FB711D5|nr:hypothetical protein [Actinomadura sp. KC216]
MAFVVVYDANVLFGNTMRDLFVRIAMKRTSRIRAKWTDQILDEVFKNLAARRPDIAETTQGSAIDEPCGAGRDSDRL